MGSWRTACPWLRGLMSRKASVLSLSKSLKQGMSPGIGRGLAEGWRNKPELSLLSYRRRLLDLMNFLPLMILQKMQEAILLAIGSVTCIVEWRRYVGREPASQCSKAV